MTLYNIFDSLNNESRIVAYNQELTLRSSDLLSRAQQFRHRLRNEEKSNWGIYLKSPFDFAACFLIMLEMGKYPVILPNAQPSFLEQLEGELDGVILEKPNSALALPCLSLEDLPESRLEDAKLAPICAQAPFALFTSGSTGEPKKIEKRLCNIKAELEALEETWGKRCQNSVYLSTVTHQHIYGLLFQLMWPLSVGRAFDTAVYSYPTDLLNRIDEFERTVVVSSPSHLSRILKLSRLQQRQRRIGCVFSSGGPLSRKDALQLREALPDGVEEVFGSTETGGVGYRNQNHDKDSELWTPFASLQIRREMEQGTLSVKSPYIFSEAWFAMADRVEVEESGQFRLLGRQDTVVKIEGKRISLQEVEKRLLKSELVKEARVLRLERGRAYLGAVLVPSAVGKELLGNHDRSKLVSSLKEELASYFERVLLPRKWRFVEEMPSNDLGKTTLEVLKSLFEQRDNTQPVVRRVERADNQVEMELFVPKDTSFFDGHFPGRPILPGVAQVDWAAQFAQEYFQPEAPFKKLEAVKFHEFIAPESVVTLTLKKRAKDGKVQFSFVGENSKYSSGRLVYG